MNPLHALEREARNSADPAERFVAWVGLAFCCAAFVAWLPVFCVVWAGARGVVWLAESVDAAWTVATWRETK